MVSANPSRTPLAAALNSRSTALLFVTRTLPKHVAVEARGVAPVGNLREHLLDRLEHAGALIAHNEADAQESAPHKPREALATEVSQVGLVLREPDGLAVARGLDANDEEDGGVLAQPSPDDLDYMSSTKA